MRRAVVLVLSLAAAAVATPAVAGDGLDAAPGLLGSGHWRWRLDADPMAGRPATSSVVLGLEPPARVTRLLGDYHLEQLRFGEAGGLRLTGGLWLSPRSPFGLDAGADGPRGPLPYLGVGYALGSGGWGLSADLGLTAQGLGAAAQVGRILYGGLSLGDALRELRLQPVLRLGVAYRF